MYEESKRASSFSGMMAAACGGSAATPTNQSHVSEACVSLACQAESLEKEISLLHERLRDVLREEHPATLAGTDRVEKCYVNLASQIRTRAQHLERLTEIVRDMRNRCEL